MDKDIGIGVFDGLRAIEAPVDADRGDFGFAGSLNVADLVADIDTIRAFKFFFADNFFECRRFTAQADIAVDFGKTTVQLIVFSKTAKYSFRCWCLVCTWAHPVDAIGE